MSGKTKNRIKKMNFQLQNRTHTPLSEEDKYNIQMASYRQIINDEHIDIGKTDDRLSGTTGGFTRPSYI
jgi:hypothetical protein